VRFEVAPPAGGAFSDTVETLCIALSPDGSQLAYVAANRSGADRRIWLRPLSAVEARPLAGTEGARSLFWSPDGRSIGFFAADKMKRLDLPGGAAVVLSDVPDGIGLTGTWGDGQILYATIQGQAIFRVPTSGGPAAPVVQPDRSRGEGVSTGPGSCPTVVASSISRGIRTDPQR
jgi:Tol biopolymer transport system component